MADDTSLPKPPALDPAKVEVWVGSTYPEPFAAECVARQKRALGDTVGLKMFGVNLVRLVPGVWPSQRHCTAPRMNFYSSSKAKSYFSPTPVCRC